MRVLRCLTVLTRWQILRSLGLPQDDIRLLSRENGKESALMYRELWFTALVFTWAHGEISKMAKSLHGNIGYDERGRIHE